MEKSYFQIVNSIFGVRQKYIEPIREHSCIIVKTPIWPQLNLRMVLTQLLQLNYHHLSGTLLLFRQIFFYKSLLSFGIIPNILEIFDDRKLCFKKRLLRREAIVSAKCVADTIACQFSYHFWVDPPLKEKPFMTNCYRKTNLLLLNLGFQVFASVHI